MSVFPQCEQFVEQHMPQLLALVPRSQDAHISCQVCPQVPSAPTAPPSLVHDPQEPHLLDSGSLWYRSLGRSVAIEQALVSEQQRTHGDGVGGEQVHDGWAAGG